MEMWEAAIPMSVKVASLLAHYEPLLLHARDIFGDAGSSGRKTSLFGLLGENIIIKASAAAFYLVLID